MPSSSFHYRDTAPERFAAPLLKVQFENDDRTRERISPSLVSLTTLFDGWRLVDRRLLRKEIRLCRVPDSRELRSIFDREFLGHIRFLKYTFPVGVTILYTVTN